MAKKYVLFFLILIISNCKCYGGNPFVDYFYPTFSKQEQKIYNEVIGYVMKSLQSGGNKWKCIEPNPFDKKHIFFEFYLDKETNRSNDLRTKCYLIRIFNFEVETPQYAGKTLQELWDMVLAGAFTIKNEYCSFKEITRTENVIECEWIYDAKSKGERIGVIEVNLLVRFELEGKKLIEKRFVSRGGIHKGGLFTDEEREWYLEFLRNTPVK